MPFKTRIWFLISMLLFVIAAVFWQMGDRKVQARKASASAAQKPIAIKKGQPEIPAASNPTVAPVNASGTNASLSAPQNIVASRTNQFPHRLANTRAKISELANNDKAVLLRNALIDTSSGDELEIPEELKSREVPDSFIVQARGVITDAFRNELLQAGAKVVSYIPNNAYLVHLEGSRVAQLKRSSMVGAVLPYEPYYKLDNALMKHVREHIDLGPAPVLQLVIFENSLEKTRTELAALGVEVIRDPQNTPFGPMLVVNPNKVSVAAMARLKGVQQMELAHRRQLANDLTRVRLGISPNTFVPENYLGLSGSNVLVNVNDTGIDRNHPDLRGRVFYDSTNFPNLYSDPEGHGTHVAGTIASSGENSPASTNASGSISGANFRGMAPGARLFAMPIDLVTGPLISDAYLQENAARTNAVISNNSWGYVGSEGEYTISSASYDSAVRDALPRVTGSQGLTFVFAAGNSGSANDVNGLNGSPDTIQSPANGKNVIAVGALENVRNITNEVIVQIDEDTFETNAVFFGETDSFSEVTHFSSRGNTGIGVEGEFGRVKPDVVAPGAWVISTRSTNHLDPTRGIDYLQNQREDQEVGPGQKAVYPINLPADAIELIIQVRPNFLSPVPMPPMRIYLSRDPDIAEAEFVGVNRVEISPIGGGRYYYAIGNTTAQAVNFNVETFIGVPIQFGNYFQVVSNLNSKIGPFYQYNSGTSMAAPAVSGLLALIQEFFQVRMNTTISPALMKAALINGSRSVNRIYDFRTRRLEANDQGWGLPNIRNILPSTGDTNEPSSWPIRFFDQSPSNALATGESRTMNVKLSEEARATSLRFTLVWTDPPGNPAAGIKLVNDLDLIVTNLESGEVYVGNNFPAESSFSEPGITNVAADSINNVENIFLDPSVGFIGTNYSVTVRARRVNVNAVTAHASKIAQDYALVVSTDSSLTDAFVFNTNAPIISVKAQSDWMLISNSMALFNQRVGASSPLGTTRLGATNQWNFYVFSNTVPRGSNVAFTTFFAPNISRPRTEADIDLYVSTDPNLTNLVPLTLLLADKSTNRGGTETIIYPNTTPGSTYYLGVKSEDQQGGDFGLFAVATEKPFSQRDEEGNLILNGVLNNGGVIPDGTPESPQAGLAFAFAPEPDEIRRLLVTNVITHEFFGDLFVDLLHNSNPSVTLNSHVEFGTDLTQTTVFDDSGEGDIGGSVGTTGPGSLIDFMGSKAPSMWLMTVIDNARSQTGIISSFSLRIDPPKTKDNQSLTILPNRTAYMFAEVPLEATNFTTKIAHRGAQQGNVDVYLLEGGLPTEANYQKFQVVSPPGGNVVLDGTDVPPLVPGGTYYVAFQNNNAFPIDINVVFLFGKSLRPLGTRTFFSTRQVSLLDDAYTSSIINITNEERIVDLKVGVRIDHPRQSDLTMRLLSPNGTKIMLAEARGGLDGTGYGSAGFETVTNLATIFGTDFEYAQVGESVAGDEVESWSVVTNRVEVVRNGFVARSGAQFLDLKSGGISRQIPTRVDSTYTLSFLSRLLNQEINGSFEQSINNTRSLFGVSDDLGRWIVETNEVNLFLTNRWAAAHGTNSIDLNGGSAKPGAIYQDISTVVGQPYNLRFAYSGSPFGSILGTNRFKSMDVYWGNTLLGTATKDVQGVTARNMGWVYTNFVVYGTGMDRLRFVSQYSGTAQGPALDDISLVPEATARLEIPGVGTNFIAGTSDWIDNRWSFTATRESTEIAFLSLGIGLGLDAIILTEEIVDSGSLYTVFTERTDLAFVPIKFANPPFSNINRSRPIFVLTNGFEGIAAGDYTNANFADSGWNVVSNRVTIVSDRLGSFTGNNALALRDGTLTRNLPTKVGGTYKMDFAFKRGPELAGLLGWWNANNNYLDAIEKSVLSPVNNPGFAPGLAGSAAFSFDGVDDFLVSTNAPETYNSTNSISLEAWVFVTGNTNTDRLIISKDGKTIDQQYRLALDSYNLLTGSIGILGKPFAYDVYSSDELELNRWYHVAMTYDGQALRLFLDGVLQDQLSVSGPIKATAQPVRIGGGVPTNAPPNPLNTPDYFHGLIDEPAIYGRALTAAEVKDIYISRSLGKCGTVFSAGVCGNSALFSVGSSAATPISGTENWQILSTVFSTTNASTLLTFRGLQNGLFLDGFTITELGNSDYFFPEESLDILRGENAQGQWTLEIWDARAGAFLPSNKLVSWELEFIFAPRLTGALTLTNAVPYSGVVSNRNITYFAVKVPFAASFATNTMFASGGVDLLFNQSGLPTGTLLGDAVLFSGTGSRVLFTNGPVPILRPGETYFLGVRPSNPSGGPINYTLRVDFDRLDEPGFQVIPLVSGVGVTMNTSSNRNIQYFSFDVSTNATAVAFEVLNPTVDVNLLVKKGTPLPTLSVFDYYSQNTGSNNESVVVVSNSVPVSLSPGRWYLGVSNPTTNQGSYVARATQFFTAPNVIDLTNNVPFTFTARPGFPATNYFRFSIFGTNQGVTFEIYNLDGNADLIARRGNLPNLAAYDAGSFLTETNRDFITLQTNNLLTSLNGDWYLAVPNNQDVDMSVTIRAVLVGTNNPGPGPGVPRITALRIISSTLLELEWDSVVGAIYEIQSSPDLAVWTPLVTNITAATTTTRYSTLQRIAATRFYRVVRTSP